MYFKFNSVFIWNLFLLLNNSFFFFFKGIKQLILCKISKGMTPALLPKTLHYLGNSVAQCLTYTYIKY